jgi:hypothetical protein
MKMKLFLLTAARLGLALAAVPVFGQVFNVSIDTSTLSGSPSLDFQFVDGSGGGDGNNTVTLSHFQFGAGGSWTGPTTVQLKDNQFFTDFTKSFTPGSTLSFEVSLTTAVDAGGVPDRFTFALLDAGGHEIPTLGSADEFIGIDITSANPTIESYGSDPGRSLFSIGAPTISAVPEPASFWAVAGVCGLGAVWLGKRRD